VHGEVVRDRHEPRREPAALGIEAGRLAPGGEEDILGELLRGLAGAQQPEPHRVDGTSEPPVQRADRSIVTGKEPFHRLLLLAWEQRPFLSSGSPHEGHSFPYVRRLRGAKLAVQTMVPRAWPERHGGTAPFVAATDGRRLATRTRQPSSRTARRAVCC